MKNLKQSIVLLSIVAVSFSACKKNTDSTAPFNNRSTTAADYPQSSLPVVSISGDITSNVTWTAGNVYEIRGIVTVRNGATLTIQPGTYIKALINNPNVQNGVLVIARDGKIDAVGTANDPIVFTSYRLLDGNPNTTATAGDFGGVIILGNARVNYSKSMEGLPSDGRFYYGGTNDEDNRGTLQYVRIEYAGFFVNSNWQINSLSLGGVGNGTTIDHVQVSYSLDDGFEFFGGTVNASNLVALASYDDQFDFDNGYTGAISDAVAIADKNSWHSTSGGNSDSNGIESDNNYPAEDPTFSLTPKTHPILINVNVFGTENTNGISGLGYRNGIRERRGSEVTLVDVIVSGYSKGIAFDADANASLSDLNSTSVHGFTSSVTAAVGTYVDGGGNTLIVNASYASAFGVPQPWYNTPGSPSTVTLPSWSTGWTKLVN
ncbi:hypothetical protein OQX63_21520 [Pedobacter sp. PF22-3]|uniref:hypothetical protein n=1 Tax=Pedobacter sp. PF22-3 TaxID=2994467 RepID=UPI002245C187|nr:hypothetical protein [Pedobacter sp. PF22-3]MCX2496090.1 hypothetical protein [Pedobacter sp. PF22-3]